MKYENFEQVKTICDEINNNREIYARLSRHAIRVEIKTDSFRIITEVQEGYDHAFSVHADRFIKACCLTLEIKIADLTVQLSKL